MDKRENVINGLEHCAVQAVDRDCDSCPVGFDEGCALRLKRDALEILTSIERVKVKHDNGITHWFVAGECDVSVDNGDRFCPACGRKLVWMK